MGLRQRLGSIAVVLAALALGAGLAACSSDQGASAPAAPGGSGHPASPAFARPGPFPVGVATLKLADRSVEVYYPAKAGAAKGLPQATYLQTDPIPPPLLAGLPKIPAGVDLSVTIPAVRDAPAATKGPFPLVIFSHGAGGWRSGYGNVLAGLASWGFVVASTDYTEYGFLAQFAGGGAGDFAKRREKVAAALGATIESMTAQNSDPKGRFGGLINLSRIAAVGHSAGGGTMFAELNDPRIGAIVGWAPVPPQGPITSHTPMRWACRRSTR